ncbi:cytochrome b6-f complex subunit PetM [Lyngbya confervoides]|uniref:Cytochrome b6-f complex subunit 7 n=1 Tax=Lyngbya confervoides BDU141951 TaxID=1574623 RepID=A0ABD4T9U9_9CYAN|nr:PetM family cytochrome b6-f complex subunit 7 [Lyngbya confervoides]MCM1985341.1 cytochrome B6 [Lyngbya confervoides BDU141951]
MGSEIITTAIIIPALVMVGLGLGYLLLKVAPDD